MTVAELQAARDSAVSVVLHKFYLLARSESRKLFCFYEGKDAPYYRSRIDSFFDGDIHQINCGGKSKVLSARNIINSKEEYLEFKKAFFVDLDYDYGLNTIPNDLFVTPTYSIENFYCSKYFFEKLISSEFNVNAADAEYTVLNDLSASRLNDFNDCILLLNSWYKEIKKKSRYLNIKLNFSLDNSPPKGFIKINLDSVNCTYDHDKIKEAFNPNVEITDEEIEAGKQELIDKILYKSLRGKYQAYFVFEFLNKLINDANDKSKRVYSSSKVRITISRDQIVSQLSQYADTPAELREFLKGYNN